MRYKAGDKVVLSDKKGVKEEFKGKEAEIVAFGGMAGWIGKDYTMKVEGRSQKAYGSDDDIDHEKTAELQRENYAKYMEEQINDPAYQDLLKEMSEPILDNVNHPSHYKQGKYETIDVIKDITQGFEGYEGYLVGNIVKYLYRANYKGNKAEDLKKGQFYYDELIKELDL